MRPTVPSAIALGLSLLPVAGVVVPIGYGKHVQTVDALVLLPPLIVAVFVWSRSWVAFGIFVPIALGISALSGGALGLVYLAAVLAMMCSKVRACDSRRVAASRR